MLCGSVQPNMHVWCVSGSEQIIMRDKYTNRPRGFGFLTLDDEDAAAQICQGTHVLDGRQVRPRLEVAFASWPELASLILTGM